MCTFIGSATCQCSASLTICSLAQARTGTGKTLAFLIPVLQNIINYDPSLEHRSRSGQVRSSPTDIRAIIISPTRELAEQIAVEARKLVRNTGVIVQTAVGGSAKAFGLRKIKNEGCHVLIGTPGRLNDILSDPYSSVRAPNLSAFVLDEADRLLDQGFAPEIEAIQDLLPKRRDIDRQTLLFSATVPQEVMEIVRRTMKPDFQFVRTVQEGEQQTHEKVPQMVVNVRGFENHMPSLLELCKRELARKDTQPFKAIVYFGATAEVTLAATIFRNLKNPGASLFHQHPLHPAQIIEMHARLSQQQRTKAADSFRRAQCGIMFSSDVTARGMDFPNVTHVIQIGIPSSRDNYIHRVGRTARGDKKGEGWLFLTALEARDARSRLSHLPMQPDESLQTASVDMTKDAQVPEYIANILTQVVDATKMVEASIKGAAYLASLGVYQWMAKKQMLVDALNNRAKYAWGSEKPPAVNPRLVQKLGLSRVEGLNIGEREYSIEGRESSSGYGGQRSRSSTGGRGDWREGRGGDRGSSGGDREGGFGRPPRNFDRSERPFPRHDRTDRMVGSYGREGRGPGVNRDSYGEQRRTRAY